MAKPKKRKATLTELRKRLPSERVEVAKFYVSNFAAYVWGLSVNQKRDRIVLATGMTEDHANAIAEILNAICEVPKRKAKP